LYAGGLVKFIASVLSLIAFIAPIAYGLNEHGWNISSLITPHYTPPKIGIALKPSPPKISGKAILLRFQANNTGEIGIRILSFNGTACISGGERLGSLSLDREILLPPGTSEDLTLILKPSGRVLGNLISRLRQERYVEIEICGKMYVKLLGIIVEFPVSRFYGIRMEELES